MLRGGLFTRFFLEDGIRGTDAYRALTAGDVAAFADRARADWAKLASMARPREAETEDVFLYPVLRALGWTYLSQQTPGRDRRDIADALLFPTPEDHDAALAMPAAARFRRGAVVVENEARDTPLDRASGKGEAPSSQILRYLMRAETQSDGAVRWGLLTNGRSWRLYWAQAPSRAEGFAELDLPTLLEGLPPPTPAGAPPDHWLRVFLLLFRRDALLPGGGGAAGTFLDLALAEGRRYEERATAALSEAVFERVFPALVEAIGRHDPAARLEDAAWRAEAREGALRLLFRLLFLLYAEDRDLLPVRHPGYRPYSLRTLRDDAREVVDSRRVLSPRAVTWWPKLRALFRAIAEGDASMGLPPYNGGLFHDAPDGLLMRLALPDGTLVALVDAMSRHHGEGLAGRWINYRDLSVQHLGGIYERLLEREPVPDGRGGLTLRPDAFARKTTGSYYTPDALVRLILRRTVGPLLAERRQAFADAAARLAGDRRPVAARLAELAALDPAERFLDLRVADIAMGSGHFLVTLVDHLADETLAALAAAAAPGTVAWGDYRSPLMARIESLRAAIRAHARAGGWPVRDEHLDDRHIVRRIVLKRCVYGVDANPMAVELAKLSLWLHSFTVGAPLSFLDHHLRHGDSLFGEFVHQAEADLRAGYGLVATGAVAAAAGAAAGMLAVETFADADVAEVKASAEAFAGVEEATAPLRALLDLHHAARWLKAADRAEEAGRGQLFGGQYGDVQAIAAGAPPRPPKPEALAIPTRGGGRNRAAGIPAAEAFAAAAGFVARARALAAGRRFLHWEPAFPGVWTDWHRERPAGGFHAVIGNPPWDRMKMQEVEWFAARVPAVATAVRAADRKRAVRALRAAGDPVVAEYDRAAWAAEAAARVAREGGAFPLMAGGDVNLYGLMVERAARLVRPDGVVGLLVPSGVAGDLGAAPFFRGLSETGRLEALLDFENGKGKPGPFFPDVHRSFKFAAIVFGGAGRTWPAAACAFFQQDPAEAEAAAFPLSPDDFARLNPNTGTAPVFRGPRDAALTLAIHARLPVLADRRDPARPALAWPVRYLRMLDMTNDSGAFRTAAELRALGAYEVPGGRWEKGETVFRPLLVGRSLHQFDHRAAATVQNAANVHNPFVSQPTTEAEHADPHFAPRPQFWVDDAVLGWPEGPDWALAFRDIARPTDARTVIAAAVPRAAFGNTAPLLLPRTAADAEAYRAFAPLLLANLNALVLDYVARQKVQGTHLNFYILEQLPVVPPAGYGSTFGPRTAEAVVRAEVLALTHTAHDLDPFARDQGHAGPPTRWDPEDRLRRRARLDAVFFHLYGLDAEAADYVLGTFPIVREAEEARWGRFRTRDLVLNTMAALAAGRPDAVVAG